MGIYHPNKFTYWSYTLLWIVDLVTLLGVIIEGPILRFAILYLFPMTYGATFIVFVLIMVIIQMNDWIFIEGSALGMGSTGIGVIHNGDWLVHVFPVLEMQFSMWNGRVDYFHALLHATQNNKSWSYYFYFIFAPLAFLSMYSLFFNPFSVYPTGIDVAWGIGLLLVINLLFMNISYYLINSTTRGIQLKLYWFFRDDV